jgi:hypothetical protein
MLMEAEAIPAELAETVDRLENWGRWAAERQKRGQAASAEGRFRNRWGNNQTEEDALELARRGSRPPIDAIDASIVDRCLAPAGGFPIRSSDLLKWRFFHRARKEVICRKFSINPDHYPEHMRRALFSLRNVLTRRKA